jgi:glutathione S-transferase
MQLELRHVDLFREEQSGPEFRHVNPNGLVPVLQDDSFTLWETVAIMQYLCALDSSRRLLPADARGGADALRWMVWGLAHWTPSLRVFIYERMFKPLKGHGEPDAQRITKEQDNLDRAASVLDGQLSGSLYVCGNAISAVDLYLAAYPMYAGNAGIDLVPYQHLSAWLHRVHNLPEWTRAMGTTVGPATVLSP